MKSIDLSALDFKKGDGLMPVVVQDSVGKGVLMLAYANEEAVKRTMATGCATYWSRSRRELWVKGATSGNTQRVKEILVDCDADALIYVVEQRGAACHTGEFSCFFRSVKGAERSSAKD